MKYAYNELTNKLMQSEIVSELQSTVDWRDGKNIYTAIFWKDKIGGDVIGRAYKAYDTIEEAKEERIKDLVREIENNYQRICSLMKNVHEIDDMYDFSQQHLLHTPFVPRAMSNPLCDNHKD